MKIKVDGKTAVEVKITCTMTCPAGSAYHTIDYLIDDICIHSATTGAIYGEPNPIAMLDRSYSSQEIHYQDILNPDPKPAGLGNDGQGGGSGTIGNRPAWWYQISKTHRQAIIEAVAQIIVE
jgi:hypothetical protein